MNTLETLKEYVNRGWWIFPLKERGKEPIFSKGFYNASNDMSVVKNWYKKYPNCNWGLWPGKSGLLVADIDISKGADKDAVELPSTLTSITGGGGLHKLFKKPDGLGKIGNDHANFPEHWDVRCDGGYIVIPPSIHPSGVAYEWEDDWEEVAELPETLKKRLETSKKQNSFLFSPNKYNTTDSITLAINCMSKLSIKRADDYESWVKVGMSLYELGDIGLNLWDDWSKKSNKYRVGDCARKWESFSEERDTKVTLGSLRHWAKEDSPEDIPTAPKNPKPADYRDAMLALGYEFKLNEANDVVYVNGTPINDIIRAGIFYTLKNAGYTSERNTELAWMEEAANNRFHPIVEYLGSLEWDGQDHIGNLAEHFEDKQGVFGWWLRRWLIGAVAKVMAHPRGQQTRTLILDGNQNLGKSFFVRWLASPLPEFHIELAINPDDKDSYIRLMSKWIWEVDELGATTRKADREALKSFLSREEVTVRKSYGHEDTNKPPMSNFIGTINNEAGFLNDPTGSRRFMCCTLMRINWDYAKNIDINQVWAQAVALFKSKEGWKLNEEEVKQADLVNLTYEVEKPIEQYLYRFFYIDKDETQWVTPTTEILDRLKMKGIGNADTRMSMDVAGVLKRRGLENRRMRVSGYDNAVTSWIGIMPKEMDDGLAHSMLVRSGITGSAGR